LVLQRYVHLDERLLLVLGEERIAEDLALEVVVVGPLLEDAGAHIQGLRLDAEGLGDLLEDLGRWLAQAALDLAQIRVRDSGQLREASQREPVVAALLTDELAEVTPTISQLGHITTLFAQPGHSGRLGREALAEGQERADHVGVE